MSERKCIVFGANGAIGSALCLHLASQGCRVFAVARRADAVTAAASQQGITAVAWDVMASPLAPPEALHGVRADAIVWAQGANCADNIHSFDLSAHNALYAANVSFIPVSLQALLRHDGVEQPCRMCVISSIWQDIARPNKLSYCTTKSALRGLVQSLCVDLGADGHLINAVLPGALDTPMTRANLSSAQIATLESMTPLGSLPGMTDVCGLVAFLCGEHNTGISGQFIAADKGFSHVKIL